MITITFTIKELPKGIDVQGKVEKVEPTEQELKTCRLIKTVYDLTMGIEGGVEVSNLSPEDLAKLTREGQSHAE